MALANFELINGSRDETPIALPTLNSYTPGKSQNDSRRDALLIVLPAVIPFAGVPVIFDDESQAIVRDEESCYDSYSR